MNWFSWLGLFVVLCTASSVTANDYLGVNRCRSCHEQAYDQWQQTAHARAHERLSPIESRDPRCAGCHSTSIKDGLVGVQCESCHGPGEHYWPAYIMRDDALARAVGLQKGDEPRLCKGCHTVETPSLRPFDYAKAIIGIRHKPKEHQP